MSSGSAFGEVPSPVKKSEMLDGASCLNQSLIITAGSLACRALVPGRDAHVGVRHSLLLTAHVSSLEHSSDDSPGCIDVV